MRGVSVTDMNSPTKPRLTRDVWITTGLQALCDQGPGALKAEVLARRLHTTKGSFYWHFRDVPDYHAALLAQWQSTSEITRVDGTAVMQLRALAGQLAERGSAEPAIRAWAKGNAQAAISVSQVDAARLAQFEALLRDTGIANPEMARILYAAALGMRELDADDTAGPEAMGTLVDLVLALR